MGKEKTKSMGFRFPLTVAKWLENKPNPRAYLEGKIKQDMNKEKNVFVIDLSAFNVSSRNRILEMLSEEGVFVQEVKARITQGFTVE